MRIYLFIALTCVLPNCFAQTQAPVNHNDFKKIPIDSSDTRIWRLESKFGVNGTQSSFVNWNAGGRNNISLLGFINSRAGYRKNKMSWVNTASIALGGLQYLGKADEGGERLQKTDDRIELTSIVGYRLRDRLYLSFLGGFRTQFLDGFKHPNDTVRVSKFMAPGYLSFGLGFDYSPSDDMSVFIAPIAGKLTFVKDRTLSLQGAFGVVPGKELRSEFGPYMRMNYRRELFTNIHMVSTLELFSNYLDRPQNIDVNGDVLFTFKVNGWFSTSLNCTVIYDHDIKIRGNDGTLGPRTQFKSVLGMGISYKLTNKKEKAQKK